jgi:hypothetical protein
MQRSRFLMRCKIERLFFRRALDYYDSYYSYGRHAQDKLRRREVFGRLAQQVAAILEQVIHVLSFALKHIYGRLEGAGDVFGKDFFDLLKLVSHGKCRLGSE